MLTDVTDEPTIKQLDLGEGHRWVRDNGDCRHGQHSYVDCAYCHVVPFYDCFYEIMIGWRPEHPNPKALAPCRKRGQ
jgi:hypothetical protein